MDKDFLLRIDSSEVNRIDPLLKNTLENTKTPPVSLFKSKQAANALAKPNQLITVGFNGKMLPNIIPFSDQVFVELCPECECVRSPKLLLPYLDRNLVIPILGASYSYYSPSFIETIYGYPHIGSYEFYKSKMIALSHKAEKLIEEEKIIGAKNGCLSVIQNAKLATDKRTFYGEKTDHIFTNLNPCANADYELNEMLFEALKKKDYNLFAKLSDLSYIIRECRNNQAFSVVPQMELGDLKALKALEYSEEYGVTDFQSAEIKSLISNGLKLSFDPTQMPLESYLDIAEKRRKTIRSIVEKIFINSESDQTFLLSAIQTEIEKLNLEVRELTSSKKVTLYEAITNFSKQNKSLIAGAITAVTAGVCGLGLVSCGASLAGGVVGKVVSSKASVTYPKEFKNIRDSIALKIQPNYERMLSTSLGCSTSAIQLWQLRKVLKKE